MKRSDLNFIIDAFAFIGLVALVVTGLIMRFVLPPFQGGRVGEIGPSMLWGWDRHQWGDVHFWIATGLMVILVVHLFLHWKWIATVVQGKPREGSGIRVLLGILSLVVLIVGALSPFFSPTEEIPRRGKRPVLQNRVEPPIEDNLPGSVKPTHSKGIRGSMTLNEIEITTGVPVVYILKELGLPADTDSESRLGQLRSRYGFDMHEARNIVENYQQ
jgi:Domain of unknown function (DUF4405)